MHDISDTRSYILDKEPNITATEPNISDTGLCISTTEANTSDTWPISHVYRSRSPKLKDSSIRYCISHYKGAYLYVQESLLSISPCDLFIHITKNPYYSIGFSLMLYHLLSGLLPNAGAIFTYNPTTNVLNVGRHGCVFVCVII